MTKIATWRMRATEQPAAAGKRGGSAGLSQGPARNGRRASITDGSYVRVPSCSSLPNLPHPADRPGGLAASADHPDLWLRAAPVNPGSAAPPGRPVPCPVRNGRDNELIKLLAGLPE